MNSVMAVISQQGRDIGLGKLGSVNPREDEGSEITLHDVKMAQEEFDPGGPFMVTVEEKRFDACRPVNFRNIRPGCDYDRIIFETDSKPRLG